MKRTLTLSIILALLVAVPMFAAQRIVPLAGHVRGVNNTFWTTDLQLTNTTAQSETVRLTFYPANAAAVAREVSLAANESVLIRDVAAPAAFGVNASTEWLGQLKLESAGDFAATARTFTGDDNKGSYGSVSEAVDPSLFASGGTVTGLSADDRFRTNLALVNASDNSITVHFDLRRENGSIAGSDDIALGPHVTRQISASPYVSRADDSPFSVRWSANGPAYLVASTVDNSSGDPTESRSIGAPSRSQFFPLVGKTQGANNTFWTTALSITNTEDRPSTVTIAYLGNDGVRVEKSVNLLAYGTFHSADVFQFLNLASGSGSLTLTSTVEFTSSARVFNTREDGATFGSALLPQDRSTRSGLSHIHGVSRDDTFRLNVAIGNENSVNASGTLRLFDDRRNVVESQAFNVPPNMTLQFSLNQTTVSVRSGEIEVETEHGVAVTVIASNIDNRSGDTVAREPEQENERQQELEIQMSTRTAAIGAPVTFTAVVSQSQQVTSYRWDFGDGQSAEGKTVTHSYISGGEFNVTLTLLLASGATLRKVEDLTITGSGGGGATGFDFSWSPQSPAPGQLVTFTALVSGAAKPGAFVKWDIQGQRLTGSSVTYTFAAAGSFEVEAELEQEGAVTLHANKVVNVGGGGGGGGATAFDFTWSPQSIAAGQPVTFTAVITGTPKAGAFVKWNIQGNRPIGNSTTFTFTANGSYEVEAELEQEGLVTLHASHIVVVGGGNPGGGGGGTTAVDFSWSPASPRAGQAVTFTADITGTPLPGSELKWKFPDDSRPQGSSATYTFPSAGTFKVSFEVAQPGRVSVQREKNVTVAP